MLRILLPLLMMAFLMFTALRAERFEIVERWHEPHGHHSQHLLIYDNVKQIYMAYLLDKFDYCVEADDVVIYHTPMFFHYAHHEFPGVHPEEYVTCMCYLRKWLRDQDASAPSSD
jgi:hypothetical protein